MGFLNSYDDSGKSLAQQNDLHFKEEETEGQNGHKTGKWHILN